MADVTDRIGLLLWLLLNLLTVLVSIGFWDCDRTMNGSAVESRLVFAMIFFFSLFGLVGLRNGSVTSCCHSLSFFLVGIVFYYDRHINSVLSSVTSTIVSAIVFFVILLLVSPLASFAMELRQDRADKAAKGSNGERASVGVTLDAHRTYMTE